MCDTCVALPSVTKFGESFFAKNSDREPNEAQQLVLLPARDHDPHSRLRCTYVEIPQVKHTYQVLLSKPYWMWGAEMGANECGVVIGNEAIFTKVPAKKEAGLIGMDYLRLALERSSTARSALDTITNSLQTYGQSGNCSRDHGLYYHNSFLIMDDHEAFVLETVQKMWIAKRVVDFYAISNAPSITTEWDMISDDLIEFAVEKKWCSSEKDFNFARAFSDSIYTRFSQGRERRNFVMEWLAEKRGAIDLDYMKSILRSHAMHPEPSFPDRSLTAWNVCMHAAPGPIRNSQTVGSLITQYQNNGITHWVTGTSAPCLSIFKPVWLEAGLPEMGPLPGESYDADSLWWQHELLHRAVLNEFHQRHATLKTEIEQIEKKITEMLLPRKNGNDSTDFDISQSAFEMERKQIPIWLDQLTEFSSQHKNTFYYKKYWQKNNAKAGIQV